MSRKLGTGGYASTTCTFVLDVGELAALDRAAQRRGLSRSAFIRTMLRPLVGLGVPNEPVSPAEAALSPATEPAVPPSADRVDESVASASEEHEEKSRRRVSTRWCSPATHSLRGRE